MRFSVDIPRLMFLGNAGAFAAFAWILHNQGSDGAAWISILFGFLMLLCWGVLYWGDPAVRNRVWGDEA